MILKLFSVFQTVEKLIFSNDMEVIFSFSDYHKLVLPVLNYNSQKPTKRNYLTYYKQFDSSKFRTELKNVLTKENIDSYAKFDEQFLKVLNSRPPLKGKSLTIIMHCLYLKATMWRSYLEKFCFNKQTDRSLKAYKNKKKYCSHFYKKEKKNSFSSLKFLFFER